MSYLAPEIRIYEGNPTKKKKYFILKNTLFNGRPPSKCDWASFGLVLSSNWVSFVVKTWQPWFGLISSVVSNSNKFCSTQWPEPSKPLINPPEAKPEKADVLKAARKSTPATVKKPHRYRRFERDFYEI